MRSLLLLLIAALPALVSGCKRLGTGAREDFARRYSCPEDRIAVNARSDLRAQDVLGAGQQPEVQPPHEVKSDPGRYAEWKKDQAEQQRRLAASYADWEVFELTGCGHAATLACHHPRTPDQQGDYPTLVACAMATPSE